MPRAHTLTILSDVHYASAAEQARGDGYELVGEQKVFWGCQGSQGPSAARRAGLDPDG